jgi:hypothetical protein
MTTMNSNHAFIGAGHRSVLPRDSAQYVAQLASSPEKARSFLIRAGILDAPVSSTAKKPS